MFCGLVACINDLLSGFFQLAINRRNNRYSRCKGHDKESYGISRNRCSKGLKSPGKAECSGCSCTLCRNQPHCRKSLLGFFFGKAAGGQNCNPLFRSQSLVADYQLQLLSIQPLCHSQQLIKLLRGQLDICRFAQNIKSR